MQRDSFREAFTIFELIVALMVIGFVTSLTLASFRLGGKQIRLGLEAQKVSLGIRRAQALAAATKKVDGAIPCGYGIVFDESAPTVYTLFAELDTRVGSACPGPFLFTAEAERVENITFPNDVRIDATDGVSPGSVLTVFFLPPAPLTKLPGDVAEASVTISFASDPAVKRRVVIRQSGEIRVQNP